MEVTCQTFRGFFRVPGCKYVRLLPVLTLLLGPGDPGSRIRQGIGMTKEVSLRKSPRVTDYLVQTRGIEPKTQEILHQTIQRSERRGGECVG